MRALNIALAVARLVLSIIGAVFCVIGPAEETRQTGLLLIIVGLLITR